MVLDDSNILQADATVIAGILILLTVTYILAPRSKQEVVGEIAVSTVIKISQVAIFVVTIFSASAILVVLGNVLGSYTITVTPADLGKYAMMIGFGALAIGISWILWFWATKHISTWKNE